MSEPISGTLESDPNRGEFTSYIPTAHVKFLEQAGITVVPLSFRASQDKIESTLRQVNGVYFPGDSPFSVKNQDFRKSAAIVFDFVDQANKNGDYFPMFLMGKSLQVYTRVRAAHKNLLH
jgi:hypothetical protein